MPLLRISSITKTGSIGLWRIEEPYETLLESAVRIGAPVNEIEHYKSELKMNQWLAARLLLNRMNPAIKHISYTNSGAPVTDSQSKISFSHSAEMVTVMLEDKMETGIDIQHFTSKIKLIKHKFCSPSELRFVSEGKEIEKLHVIWAIKEAIYKKMRIDGLIFKEQIEVPHFEPVDEGILNVRLRIDSGEKSEKVAYEFLDDYVLAYTLNT